MLKSGDDMSAPRMVREVNFILEGLDQRVGLLTKISAGTAALVVAILGVLLPLYLEISSRLTPHAPRWLSTDSIPGLSLSMPT
jgi:hypothetical protein